MGIKLSDDIYVDLVQRLAATLLPTTIMSVAFAGVATLLISRVDDPWLAVVATAGVVSSLVRIWVVLEHRRAWRKGAVSATCARLLERRFAIAYFGFAVMLGAFAGRGFQVGDMAARMLVVELLLGYGAGVAMGVSLRPWIAVPSVLLAVAPTLAEALLNADPMMCASGLLLAAFLTGGVRSMMARYQLTMQNVTIRYRFSRLARHDNLTGLANRLGLDEEFGNLCARSSDRSSHAVHCLDLDRFKQINDRHGHPTGDKLLRAVAQRLASVLNAGEVAARVGGDEFIVLQPAVTQPDEAELLARRLVRAIAQPFSIDGVELGVGTSVGFAISSRLDRTPDLDYLIACADAALCEVKRRGGGVQSCHGTAPEETHKLVA